MMRAKNGEVDVLIGPRSALFTPFQNLGLIVIDEEHENTYKSEQVPRYHARETAQARAEMEGASLVLGSATTVSGIHVSCQTWGISFAGIKKSFRTAGNGGYRSYGGSQTGVKKRQSFYFESKAAGINGGALSKKRTDYFVFKPTWVCGIYFLQECGHVVKCPHCDVSLSSHRGGRLVCHYCGYEIQKPDVCPECGSKHIGEFRAGTQQIEEIVKKRFPKARVLRMDLDTTRAKDGHEKILEAFVNEEADVLVGTQMIVKGHDFQM